MKNLLNLILLLLILSCNKIDKKNTIPKQNMDSLTLDLEYRFVLDSILTSYMEHKIQLDTFLTRITHQEKVTLISNLNENWDAKTETSIYSDSSYIFKLKNFYNKKSLAINSIFYDNRYAINFNNYSVTCYNDRIRGFGFNARNSLKNPKIIEVCNKKFFYSEVEFNCNGMACGVNITMIYDLATHIPTFIENYRVPFTGYSISDFDNDNNPDLLLINNNRNDKMNGFATTDYEITLTAYKYDKGKFIPYINPQFLTIYQYKLYGIGEYYDYSHQILSITTNNWFN